MPINLKEVKLFANTGRLIKSINRSDLPAELPGIISYAGNIFVQCFSRLEYSERTVYVYEETPVTYDAKPVDSDKVTENAPNTPTAT